MRGEENKIDVLHHQTWNQFEFFRGARNNREKQRAIAKQLQLHYILLLILSTQACLILKIWSKCAAIKQFSTLEKKSMTK